MDLSINLLYLTRGLYIPFMMQAWWLFVICTVIYFVVSYSSRPPAEVIENYTWESPLAVIARGEFKGVQDVRLWAGILIMTLVVLYILF